MKWTETMGAIVAGGVKAAMSRMRRVVIVARGEFLATLTMIGGQGVDVQFTHRDPHLAGLDADELEIAAQGSRNRERAAAAGMIAELWAFAASINDDGNPWAVEVGPLESLDSGRVHIGESDVEMVEHFFGVDLVDIYRKLDGSFPRRKPAPRKRKAKR